MPTELDQANQISLCMMVRDEAASLPRLLKSAVDWVDEVVVVDTGSQDNTPAIARNYGARVYHHPWQKDFSAHRNQSIGYARGGWILILDADEELVQETAPLLRKATAMAPDDVGCIFFELHSLITSGEATVTQHPRLFRNDGYFHYEGKVHNQPIFRGQHMTTPIRLIHHGYNLDPQAMERKYQRRLAMIGDWVRTEPQNYVARSYLAQAYYERPQTREQCRSEAVRALQQALAQNANVQDLSRIYYYLTASLCDLSLSGEALRQANDWTRLTPDHPDPYYFLVYIHLKQNQLQQVCQYSLRFMELQKKAEQKSSGLLHLENMTRPLIQRVLEFWLRAALDLQDQAQGQSALQFVLRSPQGGEWLLEVLKRLQSAGQVPAASLLAGWALQIDPNLRGLRQFIG